jgi:hypothetical protein
LLLYSGIETEPNLARSRNVSAAVGLQVEPVDLHRTDDRDRVRQEAHLRANELGPAIGFLAREERDADGAVGRHLLVDARLDLPHELTGEAFELEVHPPAQRLHARAGHLRLVVAPDDRREDVQRRVRPHEGMPAVPVDPPLDEVSFRR